MFLASTAMYSGGISYLINSALPCWECRGLPGGNSLFFCFAKSKVSKRKGDPVRRPFALLRVRCGARKKWGHVQTRYAQTSTCPDPLFPALLTSSPRVRGTGFGFGESRALNPNPNPNSTPHPVLAGLEKVMGDGLKNLDVRRRQSRQVSKFSGSHHFFKEPQSGPDCGSPFFSLGFFGEAKKSKSPAGARPGMPARRKALTRARWQQEASK